MSDKILVSNVKKHLKVEKIAGNTDVFIVACNYDNDRVFIPMEGTHSLSNCVIDNSMASFVANGFAYKHIKTFDFIFGVLSNSSDEIKPISIPEKSLKESFSDYEKGEIDSFMNANQAAKHYFFQTAFFYEK